MPGAAHHALLNVPGVGPDLQHFQIVIGFQDQEVGFAQVMLHQLGHVAEVGDDGDFFSVGAEGVADRVSSVVRNGECRDFDITDYEFNSGANVLHALDFGFWAITVHFANFAVRGFGEVGGAFPVAGHLRKGAGVVAVLVGDEDTVNFFGARAAQGFKEPQHFFFADAGVNQESAAPRFEQRGVARAARRQNGYAKRDTLPPRHASTTANGCARHRTGMMAKCWAGVNTKSRKRNYTARYLLDIDALEGFRKSDGELILGQLKAVEVADDGGRHAPGLEEFARELLDVFHGDAFEERDQILRGEVAFEVHVIARQAVHALAAAFEGKQRSAFQVVFRAAQLLDAERFIAQAAEFIEHGAHQLRSSVQ